ncbi:hypothetical protein PENSPDRAFT_694970, partial [Peniophora sp. CONT]
MDSTRSSPPPTSMDPSRSTPPPLVVPQRRAQNPNKRAALHDELERPKQYQRTQAGEDAWEGRQKNSVRVQALLKALKDAKDDDEEPHRAFQPGLPAGTPSLHAPQAQRVPVVEDLLRPQIVPPIASESRLVETGLDAPPATTSTHAILDSTTHSNPQIFGSAPSPIHPETTRILPSRASSSASNSSSRRPQPDKSRPNPPHGASTLERPNTTETTPPSQQRPPSSIAAQSIEGRRASPIVRSQTASAAPPQHPEPAPNISQNHGSAPRKVVQPFTGMPAYAAYTEGGSMAPPSTFQQADRLAMNVSSGVPSRGYEATGFPRRGNVQQNFGTSQPVIPEAHIGAFGPAHHRLTGPAHLSGNASYQDAIGAYGPATHQQPPSLPRMNFSVPPVAPPPSYPPSGHGFPYFAGAEQRHSHPDGRPIDYMQTLPGQQSSHSGGSTIFPISNPGPAASQPPGAHRDSTSEREQAVPMADIEFSAVNNAAPLAMPLSGTGPVPLFAPGLRASAFGGIHLGPVPQPSSFDGRPADIPPMQFGPQPPGPAIHLHRPLPPPPLEQQKTSAIGQGTSTSRRQSLMQSGMPLPHTARSEDQAMDIDHDDTSGSRQPPTVSGASATRPAGVNDGVGNKAKRSSHTTAKKSGIAGSNRESKPHEIKPDLKGKGRADIPRAGVPSSSAPSNSKPINSRLGGAIIPMSFVAVSGPMFLSKDSVTEGEEIKKRRRKRANDQQGSGANPAEDQRPSLTGSTDPIAKTPLHGVQGSIYTFPTPTAATQQAWPYAFSAPSVSAHQTGAGIARPPSAAQTVLGARARQPGPGDTSQANANAGSSSARPPPGAPTAQSAPGARARLPGPEAAFKTNAKAGSSTARPPPGAPTSQPAHGTQP